MLTMQLRKLLAWVVSGALLVGAQSLGAPGTAYAQDEDLDEDNVLESDEVSGDEEEAEEEEEDGSSTTIVVKDTDPSAVVIFRDRLSPYGSWVDHPTYGTVWVPSSALVGSDFAPYVSAGRWELTEDGDWLWVSDYEWGYIPFHYGRWVWVSDVGWAWIPGRVYAPAWVVWRTGAYGYVGWAPMPPAYYWVDGVALTFWAVPPAAYVFCHGHHVFHHHVHRHVIHDRDEVHRAVKGTTPYRAAKPRVKGTAHTPAQPTLKDAGIPRKSAPKSFGKHDPKATAFMRPDPKSPKSSGMSRTSGRGSFGSAPSRSSAMEKGGKQPRGGVRASGSRSLGDSDEPVFRKPSKRGSFSSGVPASRSDGPKPKRGKASSTPPSSAPSEGDAPRSKPSKSSSSRSRSSDDAPSRSAPSRDSDAPVSRPSSAPRPSSPSPSTIKKPSRAAPPPPSSPRRSGPSRSGRGRR